MRSMLEVRAVLSCCVVSQSVPLPMPPTITILRQLAYARLVVVFVFIKVKFSVAVGEFVVASFVLSFRLV